MKSPPTAIAVILAVAVTIIFGYEWTTNVDFPMWVNLLGLAVACLAAAMVIWDVRRRGGAASREE
jgi:protein-S-isoprenylcysteine O-methyltransferase Ste14